MCEREKKQMITVVDFFVLFDKKAMLGYKLLCDLKFWNKKNEERLNTNRIIFILFELTGSENKTKFLLKSPRLN